MKNIDNYLDVRELIHIIFFRKVCLLVAMFITSMAMGGFYFYKHELRPKYITTALISVIPESSKTDTQEDMDLTTADIINNSELPETYVRVLKGSAIINKIITLYNLDTTRGLFFEDSSVTAIGGTPFIEISVEESSPELSFNIVKEMIYLLPTTLNKVGMPSRIIVADEPVLPTEPDFMDKKLFYIISISTAFILWIILAILKDFYDNTVRRESEIENEFKIKNIGVIPANKKHNKAIGIKVNNAYIELFSNILFRLSDGKDKVVMIASSIKGEGKSECAKYLAGFYAMQHKKTLLIDANFLKLDNTEIKLRKVNEINEIEEFISTQYEVSLSDSFFMTTKENYDILLCSNIKPSKSSDMLMVSEIVDYAKQIYDVILIDTAAIIDYPGTLMLSSISDSVLLLVQHGAISIPRAKVTKEQIERAGGKLCGTVLTKVNPRGIANYYKYLRPKR